MDIGRRIPDARPQAMTDIAGQRAHAKAFELTSSVSGLSLCSSCRQVNTLPLGSTVIEQHDGRFGALRRTSCGHQRRVRYVPIMVVVLAFARSALLIKAAAFFDDKTHHNFKECTIAALSLDEDSASCSNTNTKETFSLGAFPQGEKRPRTEHWPSPAG